MKSVVIGDGMESCRTRISHIKRSLIQYHHILRLAIAAWYGNGLVLLIQLSFFWTLGLFFSLGRFRLAGLLEDSRIAEALYCYEIKFGAFSNACVYLDLIEPSLEDKQNPTIRMQEIKPFAECDRKFFDLVSDATVAVVGPCPQPLRVGKEIDSFDVIVRPNFTRDNALPTVYYGSKTTVVYYNHAWRRNRSEMILSSLDLVKFVCLKSGEGEVLQLDSILSGNDRNVRSFVDACSMLRFGAPFGIQNILIDLLRCRPKVIKVFSSDSFWGDTEYESSYHEFREEPLSYAVNLASLRAHDPLSNFSLMKQLLKSGMVEADQVTLRAHSSSITEYAERLDKRYKL